MVGAELGVAVAVAVAGTGEALATGKAVIIGEAVAEPGEAVAGAAVPPLPELPFAAVAAAETFGVTEAPPEQAHMAKQMATATNDRR